MERENNKTESNNIFWLHENNEYQYVERPPEITRMMTYVNSDIGAKGEW